MECGWFEYSLIKCVQLQVLLQQVHLNLRLPDALSKLMGLLFRFLSRQFWHLIVVRTAASSASAITFNPFSGSRFAPKTVVSAIVDLAATTDPSAQRIELWTRGRLPADGDGRAEWMAESTDVSVGTATAEAVASASTEVSRQTAGADGVAASDAAEGTG
jgi:hypothetical protein